MRVRDIIVLAWAMAEIQVNPAAPDPLAWEKLRAVAPDLDGKGVGIAQVEAGDPMWQVNPATVGQPETLFTWIGATGSTNRFPNSLGMESGHANQVGNALYGRPDGAAPGVSQVDNYEAAHLVSIVTGLGAVEATIVNQTYVFGSQMDSVDLEFDRFAERYGTLFISGVGNGGEPKSPATAYNGIAVGAWFGTSSHGPTADGRSKPDLTALASLTSFSTPRVSGTAALLIQAANEGWTGEDHSAARDYRTIKALILNGTDKPPDWTNSPARPLDARHGAGVLNPFRSYRQLKGGRQIDFTASSYSAGAPHPPPLPGTFLAARRGWNQDSISSSVVSASAHHYYLQVTTNGSVTSPLNLNATLVWSRQGTQVRINNLDLFLYRLSDGFLVAASRSQVDNVEHLHATNLVAGDYVLQVYKHGGLTERVVNRETYALAFEMEAAAPGRLIPANPPLIPFQARLEGEPFDRYVIETTVDFQAWIPFLTNTLPAGGRLDFSDPESPGSPRRYYRARLAP